MHSVYFSAAWKKLQNANPVEYRQYIKHFPFIRLAEMHFSIVDTEYSLLEPLLAARSYKQAVDIQNCPSDVNKRLIDAGFKRRPWGTYIIDLRKTEEQLWESIDKEARKLIKKTLTTGCTASRIRTEEELKEYFELLSSSRKLQGMSTPPYRETLRQWRIMHPNHYQVFVVRDSKGRLLAGMGVIFTKDYLIEVAAGRSEHSKEHKIYANDLIKWEIIKWGREQGIAYYDLAGVHPSPSPGSKEERLRKFKSKWGGTYYGWEFFERYSKSWYHQIILRVERWVR